MIKLLYRSYQRIYLRIYTRCSSIFSSFYFLLNEIKCEKLTSLGIPILDIHPDGICNIGSNLIMVNCARFSMLGKSNKCKFVVSSTGKLKIGSKVGMSNATIIASLSVTIGSNIMIGGGVVIVDTDFHSLNPLHWHTAADSENMISTPVVIHDNVFIGMDSVILKGVTIGANSVIGAGSVVSKDIPANQIWGGNPVKFIKNKET